MRIFCVALFAVLCGGALGEEAFRLADATVVYEDAIVNWVPGNGKTAFGIEAVETLTNVLSLVTGGHIRATAESKLTETPKAAIYLGDTRAARTAGIDVGALAPLGFRIRTAKGVAYLVSATGRGCSFAVTEFIQRFTDYRFLAIDSSRNPYTVRPEATVPVTDLKRAPRYPYHCISFWSRKPDPNGARARWFRRIRAYTSGGEQTGRFHLSAAARNSHSQFDYVPPAKYAKDHPEYYLLGRDGKRHSVAGREGQLCFTSEGALEAAYESLVKFVEKDREKIPENPPHLYDFSQMDNSSYMCTCENCQKFVRQYDRKGGFATGGDAGLQLQFVNRLARKARERYPDVFLRTFAYVSTEEPPQGIVPEDNVVIWLCDLYSKSCHDLPLSHPFNTRRRELLEEWSRIAKHLELWDYALYTDEFPDVFVDAVAEDLRFYDRIGLKSVYYESHEEDQPFYELNTYVMAQLLYGPDRKVDDLVKEYCRVYGKGARTMYEAIGFLRRIIRENVPRDFECWHSRSVAWRSVENWEKFLSLVRKAYAQAKGDERARAQIAPVLLSAERDRLLKLKTRPGAERRYAAAKDDYRRAAAAAQIDQKKTDLFLELLDLEFKDLPPGLEGVPKNRLVFIDERTVHNMHGGRVKRVPDAAVATGNTLKTLAWLGEDKKGGYYGVITGQDFKRQEFKVQVPDDNTYRWYKVATVSLPRVAIVWFGALGFELADQYIEKDGLDYDPDLVDIWVSLKVNGSVSSAKDDEGFFCPRLILHRKELK